MKTVLIAKQDIAAGTMSFTFQKPEGFTFKAGQFIDVTIQSYIHTFSLVSAPHQKELTIATRMRESEFKNALKAAEPGTEVEISEAMGSFTLPKDASKTVAFIIGGIGITPVYSILMDAAERQLTQPMYLFYSNHTLEDAAFFQELTDLQKQNPNYHFIPTMTQPELSKQKWEGETGHVTSKMIQKYIPDIRNVVWYISGPAAKMAGMLFDAEIREALAQIGVQESVIKTEEFGGY